ncbi:hypothetical protein B0H15DRAFT_946132 [Mycena belliarum]|uniref:Uncharacterized protein n=1 Tax=Mycena belliarum TaxID=1033014 RepID=A0AAD6UDI4_9AGAR|nr:hypothetical protein B0H15DRAFT_946130 [Mycena belliae]KAJ7096664.1 hypothetical protein B0H15DRAFT_946132 [Mycena belliae]
MLKSGALSRTYALALLCLNRWVAPRLSSSPMLGMRIVPLAPERPLLWSCIARDFALEQGRDYDPVQQEGQQTEAMVVALKSLQLKSARPPPSARYPPLDKSERAAAAPAPSRKSRKSTRRA